MATITDAVVLEAATGQVIDADCYGNNGAVLCPSCSKHPILIIARRYQRGSSAENPGICRSCQARIYITSDLDMDELTVVNIIVTYPPETP